MTFDRDRFSQNFRGMEDLAIEFIFSFLNILPGMLKAIEDAAGARHTSALELAAHSLKGTVSTFHAEPIEVLAWKLEQMGHSQVITDTESIIKELKSELDKLKTELNTWVKDARAA